MFSFKHNPVHRKLIQDVATVVMLWKHECTRVFADRFNMVEDHAWFENTIARYALFPFLKTRLSISISMLVTFVRGCGRLLR